MGERRACLHLRKHEAGRERGTRRRRRETKTRGRRGRRRRGRLGWRCTMTSFSWTEMTLTSGSMTLHHGITTSRELQSFSESSPSVSFCCRLPCVHHRLGYHQVYSL